MSENILFKNFWITVTQSQVIVRDSEVIPVGQIERFSTEWKLQKTLWQALFAGLTDEQFYFEVHSFLVHLHIRGSTFAKVILADRVSRGEFTHTAFDERERASVYSQIQTARQKAIVHALARAIQPSAGTNIKAIMPEVISLKYDYMLTAEEATILKLREADVLRAITKAVVLGIVEWVARRDSHNRPVLVLQRSGDPAEILGCYSTDDLSRATDYDLALDLVSRRRAIWPSTLIERDFCSRYARSSRE